MTDVDSGVYSLPTNNSERNKRLAKPVSSSITDSRYLFSTQASESPVHAFNSEWIDTYDTPVKTKTETEQSRNSKNNFGTAQHPIDQKFETPMKAKSSVTMVTPVSELKQEDVVVSGKSRLATPELAGKKPKVTFWDVIWVLMNDMAGKDKMAKICQYSLRLTLHYTKEVLSYMSDDLLNITVIRQRYNNTEKQLELMKNFFKHPSDFMKIVTLLTCSILRSRLTGVVNGISIYRQFGRFGKTPFRIRNLIKKLQSNYDPNTRTLNINNLAKSSTISDITSLYYGINDETLLLFKLKFFTNKRFRAFASRHETLAWFHESVINLYILYEKLKLLSQQEMDLKIQIQVKNKAKSLSKQLLGGLSSHQLEYPLTEGDDIKLLKDVQFKKHNAYLDVYKYLSDFVFTFYPTFGLPLPFSTLQIWLGISAATFSTLKLYREAKKKLLDLAKKKMT
ncbi:uncharacterized protein PRCAT00001349001 [Priceomyces carsonii]|uniref:uncharacterized protein n=1 Tax=Priceomyces carsonii TaxID=28549 RepID=UPI002ED8DA90|nr:unnamed protein product [Priceomyces carsonii]